MYPYVKLTKIKKNIYKNFFMEKIKSQRVFMRVTE